jgi:hypothetical protein
MTQRYRRDGSAVSDNETRVNRRRHLDVLGHEFGDRACPGGPHPHVGSGPRTILGSRAQHPSIGDRDGTDTAETQRLGVLLRTSHGIVYRPGAGLLE